MASLLALYQQDASGGAPELLRPAPGAVAWAEAAKEYLLSLRYRYGGAEDASRRQKQIVAHCVDLAIRSVQIGAGLHGDAEPRGVEGKRAAILFVGRPFGILMALLCGLLLVNLWVMSVSGVFSLFAVIAVLVVLRERRAPAPNATVDAVSQARPVPLNVHIEPLVRQLDVIAALEVEPAAATADASLKPETLEFFQDILEAVIASDQDYAFKKISRTLEQVLLSEGIEVVTDAGSQAAMFAFDTVADPSRAGKLETVRPALARGSRCLVSGYAQRFVDA